MNVRELMEKLSALDPETPVTIGMPNASPEDLPVAQPMWGKWHQSDGRWSVTDRFPLWDEDDDGWLQSEGYVPVVNLWTYPHHPRADAYFRSNGGGYVFSGVLYTRTATGELQRRIWDGDVA